MSRTYSLESMMIVWTEFRRIDLSQVGQRKIALLKGCLLDEMSLLAKSEKAYCAQQVRAIQNHWIVCTLLTVAA